MKKQEEEEDGEEGAERESGELPSNTRKQKEKPGLNRTSARAIV